MLGLYPPATCVRSDPTSMSKVPDGGDILFRVRRQETTAVVGTRESTLSTAKGKGQRNTRRSNKSDETENHAPGPVTSAPLATTSSRSVVPAAASPSRKQPLPKGLPEDSQFRDVMIWLWEQHAKCGPHKVMVPRGYLSTETCDMVQAASYHNSRVLPSWLSTQISPSPFLLPVEALHAFPTPALYCVVTMALAHYKITCNPPRDEKYDERILYHRGNALQALKKSVCEDGLRAKQLTLSSILTLMYAEMQQAPDDSWRQHFKAGIAIIDHHGGPKKLAEDAPNMKIVMAFMVVVITMSLTTSPPKTPLPSIVKPDMFDFARELYNIGLYPNFPCPAPLFLEIMRINDLRYRYAVSDQAQEVHGSGPEPDLGTEAHNMLTSVVEFSPSDWAAIDPPYRADRTLVAEIYQSAVMLYLLHSLARLFNNSQSSLYTGHTSYQSLSSQQPFESSTTPATTIAPSLLTTNQAQNPFSQSPSPSSLVRTHYSRLLTLLKYSRAIPRARSSIAWPLVVCGVSSAIVTGALISQVAATFTSSLSPSSYFTEQTISQLDTRLFIEKALDEMILDTGMLLPFVAKNMLRKFWAEGGKKDGRWRWDDCFDLGQCSIAILIYILQRLRTAGLLLGKDTGPRKENVEYCL
ncbi:c6 zinc finger domain-containing protein [Zalerion maritima]|uniref:C6 zinc finger domain-containing protein n=1 Tax=Zalerion maritima TaxID=339359 RepID=A0AAD5S1V6_9PEZI|nr:c6 zinc finger domain-containing protein [Zalerion maritima]